MSIASVCISSDMSTFFTTARRSCDIGEVKCQTCLKSEKMSNVSLGQGRSVLREAFTESRRQFAGKAEIQLTVRFSLGGIHQHERHTLGTENRKMLDFH
jgi:hypothetical protein